MSSSGDKEQDKSARHRPKPSTASSKPKEGAQMSAVEERSVNSSSLSEHTPRSSLSATPGIDLFLIVDILFYFCFMV